MAKAQDYNKLKKDQLEELCKQRSLATGGKKADLISRLEEADAADASGNEIEPQTAVEAASVDLPASAIPSASHPSNPDIEQVETTGPETGAAASAPAAIDADSAVPAADGVTDHAPAKDYSASLPTTTVADELARRKARAARFGLGGSEELDKELTRAKRFGMDASEATNAVAGLDAALPEEAKRKRGREGNETGRSTKRQDSRQRDKGPAKNDGGMSEADRLKAEARKKRFTAAG